MRESKVFPRDCGTLGIIKEIETYLGLENKDINEIDNTELAEYIEHLSLTLFKQRHWLKIEG